MVFQYLESTLHTLVVATSDKPQTIFQVCIKLVNWSIVHIDCRASINSEGFKGEVQSRITIISKERVKNSLQIGSKIMKIG